MCQSSHVTLSKRENKSISPKNVELFPASRYIEINLNLCAILEGPLFFSGLQKRLTALPPTLRSMKTDYTSLRSQVRNFSDFYGAAINDAKKQVSTVTSSCEQGCIQTETGKLQNSHTF